MVFYPPLSFEGEGDKGGEVDKHSSKERFMAVIDLLDGETY
ncbi:hypothetical protein ES703_109715 [subsurface metagenome]